MNYIKNIFKYTTLVRANNIITLWINIFYFLIKLRLIPRLIYNDCVHMTNECSVEIMRFISRCPTLAGSSCH